MKRVISLCLLFFASFLSAQNIQFLDADLKIMLTTLNLVDTIPIQGGKINMDANGDGEIQLSEALAVEYLTVGSYQDTLNVTRLDDLSQFSNLKSLKVLNLDSIVSINNLNLPGLIAFQSNSNFKLRRVDVSDCPNLRVLRIEDADTLDYVNIKNGSFADSTYSFFYTKHIRELCLDSIPAEISPISSFSTVGFFNFNCTTGIDKTKADDIKLTVFPNPTTGIITVKSDKKIKTLRLMNLAGQIILETTENQIDLSSFPKGIYVLHIASEGNVEIRKVVKE